MPDKPIARLLSRTRSPLQRLFFCAACAFPTAAYTADLYKICIGDSKAGCPSPPDAWFSCGTSDQQAATATCTSYTQKGPVVRQFTTSKVATDGGGRCGYSTILVTCK
jgi:hypothetical protein